VIQVTGAGWRIVDCRVQIQDCPDNERLGFESAIRNLHSAIARNDQGLPPEQLLGFIHP
jgi:hypothetical protein